MCSSSIINACSILTAIICVFIIQQYTHSYQQQLKAFATASTVLENAHIQFLQRAPHHYQQNEYQDQRQQRQQQQQQQQQKGLRNYNSRANSINNNNVYQYNEFNNNNGDDDDVDGADTEFINQNQNQNRRRTFGYNKKSKNQQQQARSGDYRNRNSTNIGIPTKPIKCVIWVPTDALDKYPLASHLKGSNPELGTESIEICCEGYKAVQWLGEIQCWPVCEGCQNGMCIAPGECQCYNEYVMNDNGECVFICPMGCLNGRCYLDGTCECNIGYKLDESRKFCRPICSAGCGENPRHNCTEPEVCSCAKGYRLTDNGCEPTCDPDCGPEGSCNESHICDCKPGYRLKDGTCQSECYQKCENGYCYAPNRCICKPGFTYHEKSTHCMPV